jgi:hypothetical protein
MPGALVVQITDNSFYPICAIQQDFNSIVKLSSR